MDDPPVIINQTYAMNEDDTLVVSAANGLLKGATDVEEDPLESYVTIPPAHGTLVLQRDGSFMYNPSPNYNGVDSFQYVVKDGNGGATPGLATITISEWGQGRRHRRGGLWKGGMVRWLGRVRRVGLVGWVGVSWNGWGNERMRGLGGRSGSRGGSCWVVCVGDCVGWAVFLGG